MKKSQTSSLAVVSVFGALTCFLWLPLVPLLLPIVAVGLAFKWARFAFLGKDTVETSELFQKRSTSPTTPFSQSQVEQLNAWPSKASLPYPAGVGSLPFSSRRETRTENKSPKRIRRESRQIARVMKGLDLRKPAIGY